MNVIESAAVLSDMGVADKNVLVTLQKQIANKVNGNNLFCPFCELDALTNRLLILVCNKLLFKREQEEKKRNKWVSFSR